MRVAGDLQSNACENRHDPKSGDGVREMRESHENEPA
jgi:hypothetical protein